MDWFFLIQDPGTFSGFLWKVSRGSNIAPVDHSFPHITEYYTRPVLAIKARKQMDYTKPTAPATGSSRFRAIPGDSVGVAGGCPGRASASGSSAPRSWRTWRRGVRRLGENERKGANHHQNNGGSCNRHYLPKDCGSTFVLVGVEPQGKGDQRNSSLAEFLDFSSPFSVWTVLGIKVMCFCFF